MQSKLKSNKSDLRSDLLQQLNQTSSKQRLEWSRDIQKNLTQLLVAEKGFWGAYQNLATEPNLNWLEISGQIQWCFPKVEAGGLKFHHKVSTFQISNLGVQEPVDGKVVEVKDLQGVVVPGLGFSNKGHRLGRGKGYYDRALSSFQGKKIAVCFGLSSIEDLPNEAHDVLFHHIVTESSIYQVDVSEGDLKWN